MLSLDQISECVLVKNEFDPLLRPVAKVFVLNTGMLFKYHLALFSLHPWLKVLYIMRIMFYHFFL